MKLKIEDYGDLSFKSKEEVETIKKAIAKRVRRLKIKETSPFVYSTFKQNKAVER